MKSQKSRIRLGLGHLSRLPFELRRLVWSYFLDNCNMLDCSHFTYRTNRCAILIVSRRIYAEVAALMYNGRSLKFSTIPGSVCWSLFDEFPGLSPVVVHAHENRIWDVHPSYLTLASSSRTQGRTRPLAHLPYRRLKSIKIEIGAPNPTDPGELVQMWSRVVWIVNLLQQANKLPSIEIEAIETAGRNWHTGESLHTSIEGPLLYENKTDLELLLMPFRNLRRVQSVNVQIPTTVPRHGGLAQVIKTIEIKTISTSRFGSQLNEDDSSNDKKLACEEDSWSVWLDHVLDDLPGWAAAMCRLERFSRWCNEYQADQIKRIHVPGYIGGAVLEKEQRLQIARGFNERRRAVVAFNPMAYHERRRLTTYYMRWCMGKDEWSSYAWYQQYGQDGIPRKSSPEYQNCMLDWLSKRNDRGIDPLVYWDNIPWYYPDERGNSSVSKEMIKTRDGKWIKRLIKY